MRSLSPVSLVGLACLVPLLAACPPAAPAASDLRSPGTAPASSLAPSSPPAAAKPTAPPLLVTLVVDQLGAWVAAERWPELPATGGFARLRREGTWARELRYAHAVTDTAPGHAALYTGAPPRRNGVYANEVLDAAGKQVSILRDPTTQTVTPDGTRPAPGSSIALLRSETVADVLRAQRPEAAIVTISFKDRGAIFGGGRHPDASLWHDGAYGGFVTSTAFAPTFPSWAAVRARPAAVSELLHGSWTLDDEPWVRAHAATPDDQPGEGDYGGLGRTFPHVFDGNKLPGLAPRWNPRGNDALLDLGLAAVDAHPGRAMLLAISLSTNDYIGHTFGPDSWEAWDHLHHLDASLARFFAELDRRLGADRWAVLLSADHGVNTIPEAARVPRARPWCQGAADAGTKDRWARTCGEPERLSPLKLTQELREAVRAEMHREDLIQGVTEPYVVLTAAAKSLDPEKRRQLDAVVRRRVTRHPGVASVLLRSEVDATRCPPVSDESTPALLCRAIVPDVSPDYYVVMHAGSSFDPQYVPGFGANHGTPFLADRTVPMLARAPGRVAAGREIDEARSFATFARTACDLLGVRAPDGAEEAASLGAP